MAKQIKQSDVSEADLFGAIKKSAADTIGVLQKFNAELIGIATESKKVAENSAALSKNAEGLNKLNKAFKDSTETKKQAVKVDQELERLRKIETEAEIKLEQLKQQKIRSEQAELNLEAKKQAQKNKAVKQLADETNAYKKLVIATRDQKNQSKELGATLLQLENSGKKNTKAYRDLKVEYDRVTKAAQKGDEQLKKLDSTVGDNFRNVGNYKSALGGLNKVLGAVGIGLGLNQIKSFLTESVNLSRIQEKAVAQVQAGLLSTNNAVGFSLDELKKKASEFQRSTLFGDEQILTDLTSVMLTFTNVTGESFDRAQQSALDLSTRMGGDLKGAAVQLGKALNDPIKGTAALAKSGIQFTEQQKEQIKTLTESGNIVKAQSIILDELNTQFGGSAKAAAEADGGFTQLNNAFNDAREVIGKTLTEALAPFVDGLKEFFLGLDEQKIRAFIADIGSVLKVITAVVAGFLSYKTVLIASKLATTAYSVATKGAAIAQALLTGNINKAKAAMQAFNTVTKLNPLGLLVSALTAAAVAFSLFSDSAGDAEDAQEKFNEAAKNGTQKGKESAQELTNAVIKESQERLRVLDNERKKSIANGKSQKDADEQFLKDKKSIIDEEIKAFENKLNAKINLQKQEVIKLKKLEQDALLDGTVEEANQTKLDRLAGEKSLESLKNEGKIELQQLKNNLENFEVEIIEHESKVTAAMKNAARQRAADLRNLLKRAEDLEDARISNEFTRRKQQLDRAFSREIEAIKGNSEIEKKLKTELKLKLNADLIELENQRIDAFQKIEEDYLLRQASEEDLAIIKRLQKLDEEAEKVEALMLKNKTEEAELIKKLTTESEKDIADIRAKFRTEREEKELEQELDAIELAYKERIKTISSFELSGLLTEKEAQEEKLRAELAYLLSKEQALIEAGKSTLEIEQEIIDARLALQKFGIDQQKDLDQKDLEARKKAAEERIAIAQAFTEAFNKKSDERVKKIDEELAAAKKTQDTLQQLAAQGNIDAKESIAEQAEIQRELQKQKEAELKRKARVELASSAYASYEQKIAAGSERPLAETIRDITLLQNFISTIPLFKDGTEDTGSNGKGVDGQGGFHAILHPNERVMTKEQNSLVGNLSNEQLAQIAYEYQNGKIINAEGAVQLGNGWNTGAVIQKLDELQRTIQNKPEYDIKVEEIISGTMNILKTKKENNSIIYNKYIVK